MNNTNENLSVSPFVDPVSLACILAKFIYSLNEVDVAYYSETFLLFHEFLPLFMSRFSKST